MICLTYIQFLLIIYILCSLTMSVIFFSNIKHNFTKNILLSSSNVLYELFILDNYKFKNNSYKNTNFIDLLKQYYELTKFQALNDYSNLFDIWHMYVSDKIESFVFELIIDTKFFFFHYKVKPFNLIHYKSIYYYYYNWADFTLKVKTYYKNTFNYTISREDILNFQITTKSYKKPKIVFKFLSYFYLFLFNFFKSLILPVITVVIFFFYLINYFYINIFKQLALWLIIGLLFFWLISGFNFFLKRGKFGKLTSALFRFWKRANMCFWIVEGFLFLLFFYYYLNSSQEPLYMYDYSSLNQSYLPNLYTIYCTTFLLVVTILYYYYWTLNLPNFTIQQNIFHMTTITLVLVYIYIIESYQFYYVLTIFFENMWIFNHETNLWVLEFETPRLRVKQQYLILALIAKYWHFIFIFLSWVFFILKVFEQKRTYYTHSGFNLQNLIILFWLNFLFILQWFKWSIRRFLDSIYYWFFTDSNFHFIKYFFFEISQLITCDVRHQLF